MVCKMLYKINIVGNSDNLYFDSENNFLYFLDNHYFDFRINVLNPYKYNSDNYNKFNTIINERLKLYIDFKRCEFERYIKNCIKNKNFHFCFFNSVNFTIKESNLNLNDYKIIY